MFKQGDKVWVEIDGKLTIAEFRRYVNEEKCIVETKDIFGLVYSHPVLINALREYERRQ